MASNTRLKKIVTKLIDANKIFPEMPTRMLESVYAHVCRTQRCPVSNDGAWQPWHEARLWGSGPNEDFESFKNCAMQLFWGEYDYVPGSSAWPEQYSPAGRRDAADWGIHPSSLPALDELRLMPDGKELWQHFIKLCRERADTSSYAFTDFKMFVVIVKEFGAPKALRYSRAKTWRKIAEFVRYAEVSASQALVLHCTNIRRAESWLADVIAAYGFKAVMTAIDNECNSEAAVRAYCRGGKDKAWMIQVAHCMSDAWTNIPASVIKRIPDDAYDHVQHDHYREMLLRGVSPRDLSDGLLSGPQAAQWLEEGCPNLYPWWGINVLGLSQMEYAQVAGWTLHSRLRVIEWYARKKNTRSMSRVREHTLETGDTIRIPLTALLDEITDEDLVNGINTSPDTVFSNIMARGVTRYVQDADAAARRALNRLSDLKHEEKLKKPFPLMPDLRETAHVEQIRNRQQLAAEGNLMGNCIGGYAEYCADGGAFMFTVQVGNQRSNVQINTQREVVQHYGKYNQTPHDDCVSALREFCALNNVTM